MIARDFASIIILRQVGFHCRWSLIQLLQRGEKGGRMAKITVKVRRVITVKRVIVRKTVVIIKR